MYALAITTQLNLPIAFEYVPGYVLISFKVDPENDPRPPLLPPRNPLSDFDHHHPHRPSYPDSDSDPEEPDIEEHFTHGPGGLFGRRTVFRSPESQIPENAARADPNSGESIIRRFTEMLGDIGGPPPPLGRPPPDAPFAEQQGSPSHFTYRRISGPGFRGGVSSVTITTGPGGSRIRRTGMGQGAPGDDEFARYNINFPTLQFYIISSCCFSAILIFGVEFSATCLA